MKTARRQELRTNELSVALRDLYAAASRNANYILGGAVIVVLVLVIGMMMQRNRRSEAEAAWQQYYDIRGGDPVAKPELIDQAKALATSHGSDPAIGPAALSLEATLLYESGMRVSNPAELDKRLEMLKQSGAAYQRLLDAFGSKPQLAAQARMGLATVEESLAIEGKGDKEKSRTLYKQIAEGDSLYKAEAQKRLEGFDARVKKIEIVAAPPPPPPAPPASAPAIETPPATIPAAEAPAAGTNPAGSQPQ